MWSEKFLCGIFVEDGFDIRWSLYRIKCRITVEIDEESVDWQDESNKFACNSSPRTLSFLQVPSGSGSKRTLCFSQNFSALTFLEAASSNKRLRGSSSQALVSLTDQPCRSCFSWIICSRGLCSWGREWEKFLFFFTVVVGRPEKYLLQNLFLNHVFVSGGREKERCPNDGKECVVECVYVPVLSES